MIDDFVLKEYIEHMLPRIHLRHCHVREDMLKAQFPPEPILSIRVGSTGIPVAHVAHSYFGTDIEYFVIQQLRKGTIGSYRFEWPDTRFIDLTHKLQEKLLYKAKENFAVRFTYSEPVPNILPEVADPDALYFGERPKKTVWGQMMTFFGYQQPDTQNEKSEGRTAQIISLQDEYAIKPKPEAEIIPFRVK